MDHKKVWYILTHRRAPANHNCFGFADFKKIHFNSSESARKSQRAAHDERGGRDFNSSESARKSQLAS